MLDDWDPDSYRIAGKIFTAAMFVSLGSVAKIFREVTCENSR